MDSDLRVLLRVLRLFRPYRGWMLGGALLSTVTVLASVGLMAVAGYFIAAMAVAGLAGVLMNYFLPSAGIRLFAILRTGGRYAERIVTHEATFRLLAQLRVWLFERFEPLAPGRLAAERGADLATRVQADVDTLQHAYLRLYVPILGAVACSGVVVALFALRSVAAALTLLALLLLAGLVLPLAVRRATAAPGAAIVRDGAALRVALVDALQGLPDAIAFDARDAHARHIAKLDAALAVAQRRNGVLAAAADAATALCAGLALWLVAVLAIVAATAGHLTPVEVPMLALAAFAAFEAVQPLPAAMQRVGEVVAAARRIFAIAERTPAVADPSAASPLPRNNGLALRGVRLRYEGAASCALDGVDLVLHGGERVLLTGPSGAGKSSIAGVLVRFFDYTGEIELGGHDLRRYRGEDARALVSVATQYTHLLNATLRANLLLAAPDASEADLVAILATVQLGEFLAALPAGLDTPLGEGGVRLSAGEARRLGIARVLLRKAPIVILDEPTEGLDTHTARALLAAIAPRLAGRTVLLVTHDAALARVNADRIVTMREGRVSADSGGLAAH